MDGEKGGIGVLLVAEKLEDPQFLIGRGLPFQAFLNFRLQRCVPFRQRQGEQLVEVGDLTLQLLPRLEPATKPFDIGQYTFRPLVVVPEMGVGGLCFELLDLASNGIGVKDASMFRRLPFAAPLQVR